MTRFLFLAQGEGNIDERLRERERESGGDVYTKERPAASKFKVMKIRINFIHMICFCLNFTWGFYSPSHG